MKKEIKKLLRKNKAVMRLFYQMTGIDLEKNKYEWKRSQPTNGAIPADQRRIKILNILDFTKTSGNEYAAVKYPAGYHEIQFDGDLIPGQRSPRERLDLVPLDFSGKSILDIGCNQGGMIFGCCNNAKWAVGLDYDYRMINACNLIARELNHKNCSFFVFDIDRDPHVIIEDLIPEQKVDVVMLLSVCKWVEKWDNLIQFLPSITSTLVFESNGTDREQTEQIECVERNFREVRLLNDRGHQDGQRLKRKLFLANNL